MTAKVNPIDISERAAEEISKIRETKNIPSDYGLRVGVRGGGCSAKLVVGFDKKKENDVVYSITGVMVLIDKLHTLYVIGKEIDFYDGEEGRGFLFKELKG